MNREYQSLDGRWQIAFDHGNVGKQRRWMNWSHFLSDAPRRFIDVPACWERFQQDYEGVAWYGHTFSMPSRWQDRSISLHFDAVNYLTEVYVNDQAVGYHEGGYTDFDFKVSDLIHFDQPNTLVVRVIGPIVSQDKEIDGIGQDDMPHWRGAIAGGIWQSVKLEARSRVHVTNLFADPDLPASQVHVSVTVENTTERTQPRIMRLSVIPLGVAGNNTTAAAPCVMQEIPITAIPGDTALSADLVIENPHPWCPPSPFLYRLQVELLHSDQIDDSYGVRFGMRQFLIRDDGYYLNGHKLLIKSAFFEGLYPTTLAAPPDEAFVRRELQLAIDAGFNLIRPWRKPQPPVVYDLADEMGLLFVGTMPIECMDRWPTMTPYAERRIANEVRESVRRDRNHPCIVMWEIFNEIMRPSLQRLKARTSRIARELDPGRVILDESGGFGGGASIYQPGSRESVEINDVHDYPGAPFDQAGYERILALAKTPEQLAEMGIEPPKRRVRSVQAPGRFTHVSEIGYGSLPDLEANVAQYRREGNPLTPDYRYHQQMLDHFGYALALVGLTDIYPTVRDFCLATQETHARANKLMVEAIRMNADVSGFTIHAYTDGDWVIGAGLLDIFRNPKRAYYAAKETNEPVYLAVHSNRRNIYGPDGVLLTAGVASECTKPITAHLAATVVGPQGDIVWQTDRDVCFKQGVAPLLSEVLPTVSLGGLYTLRATLRADEELIAENAYDFRVVPRSSIAMPQIKIALCDPDQTLPQALDILSLPYQTFSAQVPKDTLVLANACSLYAATTDGAGSELTDFVRAGGKVVYLDLPAGAQADTWVGNQHLVADWLPFQLCLRRTRGLWTPFAHIVRDHAASVDLSSSKAMDRDYVNVYPQVSIVKISEDDPSVPFMDMDLYSWLGEDALRAPMCTLGLDYRPNPIAEDLDYRGPGPVVFGVDLIDMPCGDGHAILSTLRLIDNLNSDPVADLLLRNIITWAAKL